MKNVILYAGLVWLAAFPVAIRAQTTPGRLYGSKVMKTESREMGDFDRISVSSGISVRVQPAETGGVTVEAEDNVVPHVLTRVNDNVLEIGLPPGMAFFDIKTIVVAVKCKSLRGIAATASSSVTVEGTLSGPDLTCNLLSGSSLKAAVSLRDLLVDLEGGAFASLKGNAEKATIRVDGGSMLKAGGLSIQSCTVSATGSSRAALQVSKDLSVTASGVSTVRYSGNPEIREKKTSDLAKVKGR